MFPVAESVAITRTMLPGSANLPRPTLGRMRIGPDTSPTGISVPYAPSEVDFANLAADFVTVNRPSLSPAITKNAPPLPTMEFTLYIADKKVFGVSTSHGLLQPYSVVTTAISVLNTLVGYAKNGTRLKVTYGALESGLWYITTMSIATLVRDPISNEVTQANVSLTFTKAADAQQSTGPTSGGVKPITPTPAPTPPPKTSSREYTVKKGDTLWGIAIKEYGSGTNWTKIADANGITNAKKLPIGKKLIIP